MRQAVPICCLCEKVRDDTGTEPGRGLWQVFTIYMAMYRLRPTELRVSYTYCPGCLAYYRNFLASSEPAIDQNEQNETEEEA